MPAETRSEHWDRVYAARREEDLTWFEADPKISFDLIAGRVRSGEAIIDVGGGASRLADVLIDRGFGPVTVLDISADGLAASRERLGPRADRASWIVADITDWSPPQRYALWHDRAVFHFLTGEEQRSGYARALASALAPNGTAIISTFAEDGPERCSNLPVVRYSPRQLADTLDELAPGFLRPVSAMYHVHLTPKGNRQNFQISIFERTRKEMP